MPRLPASCCAATQNFTSEAGAKVIAKVSVIAVSYLYAVEIWPPRPIHQQRNIAGYSALLKTPVTWPGGTAAYRAVKNTLSRKTVAKTPR